MTFLADVATMLTTGGITDPVWLVTLPETPDKGVMVAEIPGAGGLEIAMGRKIERRRYVQVLCRAAVDETAACIALAEAVWQVLALQQRQTVAGTVYDLVLAQGNPYPVRVDQNERPLVSCTYAVWQQV